MARQLNALCGLLAYGIAMGDQDGSAVTPCVPVVVGEAGREIFVPKERGTFIPWPPPDGGEPYDDAHDNGPR